MRKMKNGDYILVKAPNDYPGKKYRNRYCFEHHLVYWANAGVIPNDGEVIHHINHDKHDNRFENLILEDSKSHVSKHKKAKGRKTVIFQCPVCGKAFSRERRETSFAKKNSTDYCSRSCAGKGQNKGYSSIILRDYTVLPEEAY